MANQEQLKILRQGVEVWNKWREENPEIAIDSIRADLMGIDLREVDLTNADLSAANLREVDLSCAELLKVNLLQSNLENANLFQTNFTLANLNGAYLQGADLSEAYLMGTNFRAAQLMGSNLDKAELGGTIFVGNDLGEADGLIGTNHFDPSHISIDTIRLSRGKIPMEFLRGCGLGDWEIKSAKLYKSGLSNQEIIDINYKIFELRANQAIQISPLFISYSHGDAEFVDKLEPCFIEKGIRFWRDIHDMTAGRMERQVDRAMRQNPTVILILSKNSTTSDWAEHEARLARELEKEIGRDVLCPIALDDSWKSAKWPARLMEQILEYNILDFSKWKDDEEFGKMFNKMVAGLDMFYKAENPK